MSAELRNRLPRLFVVTDDEIATQPGFVARAERALDAGGGACALQLRAHGLAGRTFWDLAARLKRAAEAAGASLWINDRVDVALAVRADGVQLGSASLSAEAARRLLGRSAWIGRSIHSAAQAPAASTGADLLILGSVYPTGSHRGRKPQGLEALREATAIARPIVAIGGITCERVNEVMRAGAWGVAVRSGIWGAADVGGALRRYLAALDEAAPPVAGGV